MLEIINEVCTMGKKANGDYDLDGLDNFDDFDLDEFGDFESMNKPKNNREAIANMAGSFASGIGEGLLQPENQKKIIKAALPKGYSVAYDNMQETVESMSDIMNDVNKGMDDLVKTTKKSVNGFVPAMEKILPEKILEGIKRWSTQENPFADRSGPSQDDMIASSIADLTESMKQFTGIDPKAGKGKKSLKESDAIQLNSSAITNKLLQNQTEQLLAIRKLTSRSVAANEQVNFKFQQKSLEVMYQHLFATRKLLDITEQSLELQKTSFNAITHNTALPDIVKVKNTELGSQLLKQHAFESLYNKGKPAFGRVGKRIAQQAQKSIKGFFTDINGQVSDVASLFDMVGDNDMIDPKELIASLAGNWAAGFGGEWIGKQIGKRTEGNENVNRGSMALLNFFSERNSYLKKMLNSDDMMSSNPIIEFIRDHLGGDSLFENKSNLVRAGVKESDMDEPATMRWRTLRAIEDIIPGWLRMMHNELQMIRTGRNDIKPMNYDSKSGLFKTSKEVKRDMMNELAKNDDFKDRGAAIGNVLNAIDPDKKLSATTRGKLMDYIIKIRDDPDTAFNLKDIASENTKIGLEYDELSELEGLVNGFEDGSWNPLSRGSGIEAIKDDFKSSLKYQNHRAGVNSQMDRLRSLTRDDREKYADRIKSGNLEQLKELGLVTLGEDGSVNINEDYMKRRLGSTTRKYLAFGGWTGPGGEDEGAGLVHKDEYVVRKKIVNQPGAKRFLDMFNSKGMGAVQGYRVGGKVGEERGYDTKAETRAKGIGDAILDAIRANNPSELFNQTNERLDLLVALNQQIAEKGYGVIGLPKLPGVKTSWNFMKRLGIKTVDWNKKVTNNAYGYAKEHGRTAFDFAVGKVNKIKIDLTEAQDLIIDVYSKYSKLPLFTKRGFINGEYFDKATGEVIKSLKDIKGDVVDKAGNIIASYDEIKDGLYTASGRNIRKVWKFAKNVISKFSTAGIKATVAHWKQQLNVMGRARKFIGNVWNHMDDVYIKGESEVKLSSRILNNHNYFRKSDGLPIKNYKDINGAIVDQNGNEVLTAEDIAKGLVDIRGNPITTRIERLKNGVKSFAGGIKKFAGGVKDYAKNMISAGWNASTAMLGGIRDIFFGGGLTVMGNKSKNVLFEIRDILDSRLPGSKKSVFGDSDGDGDRDNSWQDILQRRKNKDKDKDFVGPMQPKDEKKKGGFGLMAMLSGISGMISGVYKTLTGGISNMIDWLRKIALAKTMASAADGLVDGVDGPDGRRRGGRRGGRGGRSRLGRIFSRGSRAGGNTARAGMLTRAGKALTHGPAWAKAAGAAALAGGAYYMTRPDEDEQSMINPTTGEVIEEQPGFLKSVWNGMTDGGTADGVASLAGSTAAWTAGTAAVTGGIGGALAGTGVAAGALAALGGPITLGVIAAGAAIYGGYKLYKYFSSDNGSSLNAFRMAQYGFSPNDKDQVAKIAALEKMFEGHVKVGKGGGISIDNGIKYKDVAELFEVKDQQHLKALDYWLKSRFKPIYGKWLQSYQGLTGKTDLTSSDNIDKALRVKLLAAVHSPNMPEYSITTSPFKTPAQCTVNGLNVNAKFNELDKVYKSTAMKESKKLADGATDVNEKGIFGSAMNVAKKMLAFTPLGMAMSMGEKIGGGLKTAGNWIADKASSAWDGIKSGASAVGGAISGGWSSLVNGLKGAGNAIGNSFSNAFTTPSERAGLVDSVGVFQGTGGSIANIPQAKGKGWANVKDTILAAAKMVGVDPAIMAAIPAVESGYDPTIKAKGSTAAGLYQFISSTWKSMVSKYGSVYGIPANASPLDARANAVLGAAYIKENAQVIKGIKGGVNAADVYMAHFLGGGGVKTFLTALKKNPNTIAAQILPAAASANKSIFFDGGRPRTVAEVYALMSNKLQNRAGSFGVDLKSLSSGGTASVASAAAAGATAPSKPGTPPPGIAKPGLPATIAKPGTSTATDKAQAGANAIVGNATKNLASSGGVPGTGGAAPAKKPTQVTEGALKALLTKANGGLAHEGRKYVGQQPGVDLNGMNKNFMALFYAMVGEGIEKGIIKNITATSGFRSYEKQAKLYADYQRTGKPLAAKPGKSKHEFGIALDISSGQANTLANSGLLGRWGFYRPLVNHKTHPEPWHLENVYFSKSGGTETAKSVSAGAANAGTPAGAAVAQRVERNIKGGSVTGIITPDDPTPTAINDTAPTNAKTGKTDNELAADAAKKAETKATNVISPHAVATGGTVSKPLSIESTSSSNGKYHEVKPTKAQADQPEFDRQASIVKANKTATATNDAATNTQMNKYFEQSIMHQASMDHSLKQLLKETQSMNKSIGGLAKGLVNVATSNVNNGGNGSNILAGTPNKFSDRDPISLNA